MKQPWVVFGTAFQSPKLLTTVPLGSNSMKGGACCATSASLSVMLFRLTMNTLSWASTHTPLTWPVTQLSSKGLGQAVSTSNFDEPSCAWTGHQVPRAIARPMQNQTLLRRLVLLFISPPVVRSNSESPVVSGIFELRFEQLRGCFKCSSKT